MMQCKSTGLSVLMAALVVIAVGPGNVHAQQPPTIARALPSDAPVRIELGKIFEQLSNAVKEADGLMARLREATKKTPEMARQDVNNAASVLSKLADSLKPTGDVAGQLQALRNAAQVHRKRVADLAPNVLDDTDRQKILEAWDSTLRDADNTTAAMADMRAKLTSAVENIRMRQVGISEMVLAGQYQGAVEAVKRWLSDLENTVNGLHQALEPAKPTS